MRIVSITIDSLSMISEPIGSGLSDASSVIRPDHPSRQRGALDRREESVSIQLFFDTGRGSGTVVSRVNMGVRWSSER
jgi:hypothetical protein